MYGDDYIVISDDGEFNYSMYVNDSNGDSFSISTNVANSSIIVEDGLVTIVGQISGLATFQSFSILVTVRLYISMTFHNLCKQNY